jgi:galactokinase
MNLVTKGEEIYQQRYGSTPTIVSQAPGRLEILGNHTDYNGGYVLTVAIDKTICLIGEPLPDSTVTLYSETLDKETTFSVDKIEHDPEDAWADYVKGVLDELHKKGITFGGFRAVIYGDLPIGGGVSSSAALEASTAYFIKAMNPYDMELMDLARLCRAAENNFVGMPCGLMDQFSSIFGQKDTMICLDCAEETHKAMTLKEPIPDIVLCNSGVKHKLVDGEYKARRSQCECAASQLGNHIGRVVNSLREITMLEFMDNQDILDDVVRRRARHVLFENQRVLRGVAALQLDDLKHLGELMRQSHESSRDLFENSCPELDWLIEEACKIPGCYGGKLTGGGFGGCTVNVVHHEHTNEFVETIQKRFAETYGQPCETTICTMGDGAKIVKSTN